MLPISFKEDNNLKKTIKADVYVGIVGIIFGIVILIMTTQFEELVNVPIGPEFFPSIMATGLITSSYVLIVQSIEDKGKKFLLIAIAILIAMTASWELLGFLIVAPIAMFLLMKLFNFENYFRMALISLVTCALVWLLFWKVLAVELPLGPMDFLYTL
ncbi:MAG: tripartite tricarboxylate transporter TctB family protein [Christensenellaceae bacterium]|nr:tripartite tricarboxylate transporter TctB family protein [Christensenellaceae bacterium]